MTDLARPHSRGREAEALAHLAAVDGSIFAAFPRMTWALWQDAEHPGVKLQLQFSVAKWAPVDARITPAACSEPAARRAVLPPGLLHVNDLGDGSFELFRTVLDAGSSFVTSVKDVVSLHVQTERAISPAAAQGGVIRDVILKRLVTSHCTEVVGRAMRLVIVRIVQRKG